MHLFDSAFGAASLLAFMRGGLAMADEDELPRQPATDPTPGAAFMNTNLGPLAASFLGSAAAGSASAGGAAAAATSQGAAADNPLAALLLGAAAAAPATATTPAGAQGVAGGNPLAALLGAFSAGAQPTPASSAADATVPAKVLGTEPYDGPFAGPPIVIMHGAGDALRSPGGWIPRIRDGIARTAQTYVYGVEICSTPDKLEDCYKDDETNSLFMPMDRQVEQFARVVRAHVRLKDGFNAIGLSQGSLVIRGYIHKYNDPPVKTFLAVHSPMMGIGSIPHKLVERTSAGLGGLLESAKAMVYTPFAQNMFAPANYLRDTFDLANYRAGCQFLPYINNEVEGMKNATYKANFASLEKLILVRAEGDLVVGPSVSAHFGFFADGSNTTYVSMKDAPWYTENWFGLKDLDEAGKIVFLTTPAAHLVFGEEVLDEWVKAYFPPREMKVGLSSALLAQGMPRGLGVGVLLLGLCTGSMGAVVTFRHRWARTRVTYMEPLINA